MKINWRKFIGPIPASKKYKFTKLPAQKVKRHSDFGRSSKIADQNIRDTLGPDPLEFGTVRHESARILRQESIGRRWAERKFARDLPQEIKKGRIVIARKIKSFNPNQRGAYKSLKVTPKFTVPRTQYYKSDILSKPTRDPVFRNPKQAGQTIIGKSKIVTSKPLRQAKTASALKRYKKVVSETDALASRISQRTSPFRHKLTETKFIKSKRFKKGLPRGMTSESMLWAPKESSKGSKIIYATKQARQEKIFQSGKGYFDVKSQSFKYRPKKRK
jgi:hypothetical protein